MMTRFLSSTTPYTFVWHDNAGQSQPENSAQLKSSLSAEGLTIDIAANAILKEPIILLNSAAIGNKSQNVISIGKNAQVQIIEYLMSEDNDSNNAVCTNIYCADGAQLKHCILQQSAENATITQQSITAIYQATASKVYSNIFSFGGGLNRIELAIALQGENAECQAASLAFTNGTETQEVLLKIDHEHEQCTSRSIVRGILKDKSITDFTGRITVHPGAKKTIADLQIRNLLCSPKAQATNKPELEIYNDDVRCSHGSSTGQIDEDALFYMRTRGIDIQEATAMLIAGFIQPAIDSCTIPAIAEYVRNIIAER
jgi:Fe-S cluster assembly protein SufD